MVPFVTTGLFPSPLACCQHLQSAGDHCPGWTVASQHEPIWDLVLFEGPSKNLSRRQKFSELSSIRQIPMQAQQYPEHPVFLKTRHIFHATNMTTIRGSFRLHSESSWIHVKSHLLTYQVTVFFRWQEESQSLWMNRMVTTTTNSPL